jgi:hypothetical protein
MNFCSNERWINQEADTAVGAGRPMGKAARATAERFGFDAMAKQLVELYGKLDDD